MIGALTCIDDDVDDTHKYHILTMWEIFQITKGNVLGLSTALDYEKNKSISVEIRAMDSGEIPLSFVKTFKFDILNVNEKPTELVLSHSEVMFKFILIFVGFYANLPIHLHIFA